MSTLRARAAEEKEGRRRQLREAAADRFDQAGYAATTMAEIAGQAGLAKGTTYLYYRSKEELFLDLLLESVEEWRDGTLSDLDGFAGTEPDAVAALLARGVARRPRLVALLSLLHPVLERGTSPERLADVRWRLLELWTPLAAELRARFRDRGEREGARLLFRVHALVVGLAGLADDPSWGRRAIAAQLDPVLFAESFEAELASCMAVLLRDWIAADPQSETRG